MKRINLRTTEDKLNWCKRQLRILAAGHYFAVEESCNRRLISFYQDDNLDYNFQFPDGTLIRGDIGNGGQGMVVKAWEIDREKVI